MPVASQSHDTCWHQNLDYAKTFERAPSFRRRHGEGLRRTYREFDFSHSIKQTPWRWVAKTVIKNIRTAHISCLHQWNNAGNWHSLFAQSAFNQQPAFVNSWEISAVNTSHILSWTTCPALNFRKPACRVIVTVDCRKLQQGPNIDYDNRVDKGRVTTKTSGSPPYVWAHD